MRSRTSKPPEIRPGMPVIPANMTPKSRNVYVVISCDYRRGEATCQPLSRHKRDDQFGASLTAAFKNLIPLDYFGVSIAANMRLNLYAALPNKELANRTHEIAGKTIAWQPDKASQNLNAETQSAVQVVLQKVSPAFFMRADEYA